MTWSSRGFAQTTKCRGLSGLRLPPVAVLSPCSGLRSRVQPIERGLLRIETDVRVVLKHPPREMSRDRLNQLIWFAGLQQTRITVSQAGGKTLQMQSSSNSSEADRP